MVVHLTYFRESGKYYSDGKYDTNLKQPWEIWDEVREMRNTGRLPGLMEGHSRFIVSVDVPEHIHNHPHLIM